MKTRSNSSNKAEKQIFEDKTVKQIKLQITGNGFRHEFTETLLQIDRKTILKNDEAQKPKCVFENKYFHDS